MDFSHLTSEEIAYELALRYVVNLSSMTHRNKVMRLNALVDEENSKKTVYINSEHVMDPSVNIDVCVEGIKQLQTMIELANKSANLHDLSVAYSRLVHYKNRLAIVKPPESSIETLNSLRQIVNTLLASVSSVVVSPVNQLVTSDKGAIRKIPQQGTPVPMRTKEKTQELTTFHGGASNYQDDNAEQQTHSTPTATLATPESIGRGRGRGTPAPARLPLNYRLNSSTEELRTVRDNQRNDNNGDMYNQLRNDLINDLLRLHVQRGERTGPAEDRRILKAIHNWPFKFRGEKDIKTLNTFLDRVESFALSEGVNEEVLLASVKHLLQEDALDWYARAISQGVLTSWNAFKEEIRKEYLPAEYGQFIRAEAFFRYQGQTEPFLKYYREIVSLFRFAQPKMSETEKFFIVRKNMNAEYASTVAAARPRTLDELVEVCASYDDTKLLLSRQQRRVTIPHESLMEPNRATPTPSTSQRQTGAASAQRFGRIHAVELDQLSESSSYHAYAQGNQEGEKEEEYWQFKIDQLTEQVNAIKTYVDRRFTKGTPASAYTSTPNGRSNAETHHKPWMNAQSPTQQQYTQRQPGLQSGSAASQAPQQTWQQEAQIHQQSSQYQQQGPVRQGIQQTQGNRRMAVVCWNCEEEGHRHADCRKPQAYLFCHGCGKRGYTLRNCYVCQEEAENMNAGNLQ